MHFCSDFVEQRNKQEGLKGVLAVKQLAPKST